MLNNPVVAYKEILLKRGRAKIVFVKTPSGLKEFLVPASLCDAFVEQFGKTKAPEIKQFLYFMWENGEIQLM